MLDRFLFLFLEADKDESGALDKHETSKVINSLSLEAGRGTKEPGALCAQVESAMQCYDEDGSGVLANSTAFNACLTLDFVLTLTITLIEGA